MYEKNIDTLVSIVVITYNSEKFVIETLDSIRCQTYKNIELIISDDASTDQTLYLCQNWLRINGSRFVNCNLLSVEHNSGISANCNRGFKASNGEWIKIIAGDDMLLESCIEDFLYFSSRNKNFSVLFSRIIFLKNGKREKDKVLEIENTTDIDLQKELILNGSSLRAPGCLIKKEALIKAGLFDERYPFLEDLPLWISLNQKGFIIGFVPKYLILYRIHSTNIFSSKTHFFEINTLFYDSYSRFLNEILFPLLLTNKYYLKYLTLRYFNYIDGLIVSKQKSSKLYSFLLFFLKFEFKIILLYFFRVIRISK